MGSLNVILIDHFLADRADRSQLAPLRLAGLKFNQIFEVLMEKELWPMTQGYPSIVVREGGLGCDQMKTCCIE